MMENCFWWQNSLENPSSLDFIIPVSISFLFLIRKSSGFSKTRYGKDSTFTNPFLLLAGHTARLHRQVSFAVLVITLQIWGQWDGSREGCWPFKTTHGQLPILFPQADFKPRVTDGAITRWKESEPQYCWWNRATCTSGISALFYKREKLLLC